jgi:hypothetical protein
MKLYTVSVIDSRPKARNAKVLVLTYATMAATPIEAAGNVSRENAVLPEDRVVVKECDSRTIVLPSRSFRANTLIMRVIQDGMEFTGAELPAREAL